MATKKTTQKANSFDQKMRKLTEKNRAANIKAAQADMKKHGFKTPQELVEYYDKKRGY